MNEDILCPVCKRPMDACTDIVFSPKTWTVTTQYASVILNNDRQVQIFGILLKRRYITGLTSRQLIDIIYAADPNGGPSEWAMAQEVRRLRLTLVPTGIIIQKGYKSGFGCQIMMFDPEAAEWYSKHTNQRMINKFPNK